MEQDINVALEKSSSVVLGMSQMVWVTLGKTICLEDFTSFSLIPPTQSWCMKRDVPCALAGLGTVGGSWHMLYLTAISK